MGPSFHLFTVRGIQLRMHWTFLLLLGWFFIMPLMREEGGGMAEGLRSVAFILAVFGCVVLHEFGHAFAARMYGIRTRDVTLLPIGGVARLERMPENPVQELVVALAGPAVNVVLAGVFVPLGIVLAGSEAFSSPENLQLHGAHFIVTLGIVNIVLILFNLIPAFPMDGGRVLRALLAMAMDRVRATNIAARVGQFVAVGFLLLGLYNGNVMLMLVAVFVFLGAGAEAQSVQSIAALRGVRVGDAMIRRFRVLRESDTLQAAADELISGEQQDFPVLRDGAAEDDGDAVVGVLTRGTLISALAGAGMAARVGDVMSRSVRTVSARMPLAKALEAPPEEVAGSDRGRPGSLMLVVESAPDGRRVLVGMVTQENLTELVAIRSAVHSGEGAGARAAR